VSALRSDADHELCVAAIDDACRETGFFVAVNHGLAAEIEQTFAAAHAFFAQPQADKEQVPRIDRYGFVPRRDLAIDTTRQAGNTEYLELGRHDEVPMPTLDGFAAAIRTYQDAALQFAHSILAALATALGVESTFFAERMTDPQCRLRFLHYFAAPTDLDDELAVPTPAHTDYGAITLLATDGVPGLEVRPHGGAWQPVEAPAGSLIINLGDMLARWTNDEYQSTPHRVVGPVGTERFSIPFFVNPDPLTTIECIPTCVSDQRPCNYEPVTAHEFLAARIDGSDEPYIDAAQ